jgi:hypothetical protein
VDEIRSTRILLNAFDAFTIYMHGAQRPTNIVGPKHSTVC